MILHRNMVLPLLLLSSCSLAATFYGTPEGSGDRSGTAWETAFALDAAQGLQQAWNVLGPQDVLCVGSGTYKTGQSLTITDGGTSPQQLKTLRGVDTGSGKPVFVGTWSLEKLNPLTLFHAAPGASYFAIEHLEVRQYGRVLWAEGRNHGYRVRLLDIFDTDNAFQLYGGATPDSPNQGSRDLRFEHIRITRFAHHGFHIREGHSNVEFLDCHLDGGGAANDDSVRGSSFGFHISHTNQDRKIIDRRITFTRCSAANVYNNQGDTYWQGDGFCVERASDQATFNQCVATGCTDGGWDVKSDRSVWNDCMAIGNKRNYRVWSKNAEMNNCLAAFPTFFGGKSGGPANLHANLGVTLTLHRCTLLGSDQTEVIVRNSSVVRLQDCIVAPKSLDKVYHNQDKDGGLQISGSVLQTSVDKVPFARLELIDTVEYRPADPDVYPDFIEAVRGTQRPDAFNSRTFGEQKGYFHLAR